MPGTGLGTYAISGTLGTNTCGTGLEPPNPWSFDADLSRDGSTLYWRQNGVIVSGTLNSSLQATITSETTGVVVQADASFVGCAMSRDDTITVKLGSDSSTVSSVSGSIVFKFAVTSGYDCSSQLSSHGGAYDTLPCSMTYSFTGTRTGAISN